MTEPIRLSWIRFPKLARLPLWVPAPQMAMTCSRESITTSVVLNYSTT